MPLKKLLDDSSAQIRLTAAKAIFQVTNDQADMEKQFAEVFAKTAQRTARMGSERSPD